MSKYISLLAVFVTAWAQAAAPAELSSINWGVSERQGKRPTMEDAYAAELKFKGNPQEAFFGIYDGHGGDEAAIATARGLPTASGRIAPLHELVAQSSLSDDALYRDAYLKMDKNFQNYSQNSGTTAITAHIMPGPNNPLVYLAWAGDARAVLVRQNGTVSDEGTSVDHKPENSQEKRRIEEAGGFVSKCGPGYPWRVGGILAIPRSLGDGDVKGFTKGIIADPEVKVFNLLPRHQALILACDGVWDVLSNEQAATIVNKALAYTGTLSADPIEQTHEKTTEKGNNSRAQYAARALRDAAYQAGSTDNISVLVVEFNWQPEGPQQQETEKEKQERRDASLALAMQLEQEEQQADQQRREAALKNQEEEDARLARQLQEEEQAAQQRREAERKEKQRQERLDADLARRLQAEER